jgi:hypothetical protein
MKELEACVCEMTRVWNGAQHISENLFQDMMHGTYLWQKIVERKSERVCASLIYDYLVFTSMYQC